MVRLLFIMRMIITEQKKHSSISIQIDDFDVIIYGNKWYIESNVYRIRIPRSVFNHIDMLLKKDGCTYLYN